MSDAHQVPFSYTLKKPVKIEDVVAGGERVTIAEIKAIRVLCEPELKHLRKIFRTGNQFDRIAAIIDQITDWPKEHLWAVENLNFRDVDGFGDAVRFLFETDEESTPDGSSSAAPSA